MSDLLKDAIADAKAIKELAIQNAKNQLAETFAPQIKNIVSTRLQEEEDLFGEEEDLFGEEEEMDPTATDEGMYEGEEEDDFELEDEPKAEGYDSEDMMEEEDDMDLEEGDYDVDKELDEILRELEDTDLEEGDDYEEDEMTEGEEEEEDDVAKLENFIREMIAEVEGEEEMVDEGEHKEDEEMEDLKKEVEEKDEELKEAYRTIKFLKGKINEALLINSKLLYSGKIFRSFNLDESQKVSILESFDRATTIRETKLLYASLRTTLTEVKSQVSKKSMRLKESRASKPINSTKPSDRKILEENSMVSRLQQLAGIIK